jgi:hypothetical protein
VSPGLGGSSMAAMMRRGEAVCSRTASEAALGPGTGGWAPDQCCPAELAKERLLRGAEAGSLPRALPRSSLPSSSLLACDSSDRSLPGSHMPARQPHASSSSRAAAGSMSACSISIHAGPAARRGSRKAFLQQHSPSR